MIIGGTFDNETGKPSYFVEQLASVLNCPTINGGNIEVLKAFQPHDLKWLIWMPNIDNAESKILPRLKKDNPAMLLIQSKRVIEKEYYDADIIGRLLQSHAALGIVIRKPDAYQFSLLDPLGNKWIETQSVQELATALKHRIGTLLAMNRVRSENIGTHALHIEQPFLEIIHRFGEQFNQHVNAINPNRLLGNASTRCAKGFPATRTPEGILVSRRNVEKATLSTNDFVLVDPNFMYETLTYKAPEHLPAVKPSVDAPIQRALFQIYSNVNYMLHGHVYVKNGLMTTHKVPCGFLEEVDQIVSLVPDFTASNFCINLYGHGCLMMAKDLSYFDTIELMARPFPEC